MKNEYLTLAGVDFEELMNRIMNNEALLKILVKKFIEDKTIISLQEAINNNDIKQAEITSHTLKGMSGNMSLIELFRLTTEQVKLFRENKFEDGKIMINSILNEYNKTIKYFNLWLENN